MTAALEDAGQPVHYYENIEGGHGGAADAKQEAFMSALAYTFLWNELREVAWLTSVVGGLSVIGVALAVVLTIILAS